MSVNDATRIIIDDSRVALQIVASLIDNTGGVFYDHNVFIVLGSLSNSDKEKKVL
jgi:hypothetical protein